MRFAIVITVVFLAVLAILTVYIQFFASQDSEGFNLLKSTDSGQSWRPVNQAVNGDALPFFDTLAFEAAKVNHKTVLYLATQRQGLWRSFDLGETWQIIQDLSGWVKPGFRIFDIETAGDWVLIAGSDGSFGRVLAGKPLENGNFSFQPLFVTSSPADRVLSIALDDRVIYLGTLKGSFIRSLDNAETWQGVHWFDGAVSEIELKSGSTEIIVLANGQLFSSNSRGVNWQSLGIKGVSSFLATRAGLFAITKEGLVQKRLRDTDKWRLVSFPSSRQGVAIDLFRLDPLDANKWLAISGKLFYVSQNSGKSWQVRPLPVTRRVSSFWINPGNSDIIVLGTGRVNQVKRGGILGF